MNAATKQKISEALKGRFRGPRGPHNDPRVIIDFDVERLDNGRVRVSAFNDIGGRGLMDFTIASYKAASLARALLAAVGDEDAGSERIAQYEREHGDPEPADAVLASLIDSEQERTDEQLRERIKKGDV